MTKHKMAKKQKSSEGKMAPEYLKMPYARVVVPESDGTFRAEILEFPGCIAVGDAAPQALANLEDVAASWLESMLARGQSIPAPLESNDYSGKLVLRLSKSVHRKAALAARRDGVSLNYFIANCVAEYVGARAQPLMLQPQQFQAVASFSVGISLTGLSPGTRAEWPPRPQQVATSAGHKLLDLPVKSGREDVHA